MLLLGKVALLASIHGTSNESSTTSWDFHKVLCLSFFLGLRSFLTRIGLTTSIGVLSWTSYLLARNSVILADVDRVRVVSMPGF